MKMTKIALIALSLLMIIGAFVSCGEKIEPTKVYLVIKADDHVIYDGDIVIKDNEPTVLKAVQAAMDKYELDITLDENTTTILDVGDYKDSDTKFWEFTVNDLDVSKITKMANVYEVKEGDKITWTYSSLGSVTETD